MSRRRLFASGLPATGGPWALDEEARHHAQVLRLDVGAELCLFDGEGREADAHVIRVTRRELVCELSPPRSSAPRSTRLCLIVCVPKAAKLETIVRMGTEIGVHAIYLAHSERSVPKLSAESPKLERLRRIALEACAQSSQAWAPQLFGPMPLTAAASAAPADAEKMVFWEQSQRTLELTPSATGSVREVWVVVGPEGGICEQEVDVLAQLGYAPVGLGAGILRVETACIVIAALLLDRMGALR